VRCWGGRVGQCWGSAGGGPRQWGGFAQPQRTMSFSAPLLRQQPPLAEPPSRSLTTAVPTMELAAAADPAWREAIAAATAAAPSPHTADGGSRKDGCTEPFTPLVVPSDPHGTLGDWVRRHRGLVMGLAVLACLQGLVVVWGFVFPQPVAVAPEPEPEPEPEPQTSGFPQPVWRSYFTVGMVLAALGGMGLGTPPDVTMMAATLALVLTGTISRQEAYQGFADPGPVTVGAMFVIAAALNSVGAVGAFSSLLLGDSSSLRLATARLTLAVAGLSAFINNTPIVVALIPLVQKWAWRLGLSPSKLLMPLSFSSMIGGMCTLIGTSTNLIVAARYEEDFPDEGTIGLFGPGLYGVPVVVVGGVYMLLAGQFDFFLPPRAPTTAPEQHRAASDGKSVPVPAADPGPKGVRGGDGSAPWPRTRLEWMRFWLTVGSVVTVVVLSATDVLNIDVGALCCCVLLVGAGCIDVQSAIQSVNGRVMLAVVFAFGVSDAMQSTGVAALIADGIVNTFAPFGPTGVLFAVCLIACVVGSVVSNNASALLLYPIVIDLSNDVPGLNRRQAVLVLMVASSASFLTPISYQTNLMVMNPGQYEFLDFFRFGAGLQLVSMATIVFVGHFANSVAESGDNGPQPP
jgi:di/tricarboxylate transporter